MRQVASSVARLASAGVVVAVPLVAVGITVTQVSGGPFLECVSACLLATVGFLTAWLYYRLARQSSESLPVRGLWTLASVALAASMVLAVAYGVRSTFPCRGWTSPGCGPGMGRRMLWASVCQDWWAGHWPSIAPAAHGTAFPRVHQRPFLPSQRIRGPERLDRPRGWSQTAEGSLLRWAGPPGAAGAEAAPTRLAGPPPSPWRSREVGQLHARSWMKARTRSYRHQ